MSIALGFCALKTGPLSFYVIMGYCHFISYIHLRFCLEIGIGLPGLAVEEAQRSVVLVK